MHERIVGLYEENAAAWDRLRGRDLFEKPWLDRFAALLSPGSTILDIGCGMAEPIARYFIEGGCRVTGCDSSPSLIAMCGDRFPDHEWIVADMRALDLGRRFDGVLAWHSSFHLTAADQRALFPRLAAHTKPGGHLMFTSGEDAGERTGEWMGEPLYHASLAPEEYRGLLASNGFAVIDCRLNDPECGGATVWIARRGD
jgi:cyclopropane fatty-acyl-phospholipid synthase-like methyltransferase